MPALHFIVEGAQTIIGIGPHIIVQGIPIAIIAIMAFIRSFIMSICEASIGVIRQTMPSLVISQVILHIIGIIMPFIGMPIIGPIIPCIGPCIGPFIMPPAIPFIGDMLIIIGFIIGIGIGIIIGIIPPIMPGGIDIGIGAFMGTLFIGIAFIGIAFIIGISAVGKRADDIAAPRGARVIVQARLPFHPA